MNLHFRAILEDFCVGFIEISKIRNIFGILFVRAQIRSPPPRAPPAAVHDRAGVDSVLPRLRYVARHGEVDGPPRLEGGWAAPRSFGRLQSLPESYTGTEQKRRSRKLWASKNTDKCRKTDNGIGPGRLL